MQRNEATQLTRDLLNAQGLSDWHIRLVSDLTRGWLGKCVYTDKAIYLNSLHIDTHPTEEVDNTIRHEVAHALTFGHSHDDVWAAKARELGCTNTSACATYGFDARAIDAIRSGALLEVTFDEEIVRTPKYKVTRLQETCPTCGKIAVETSRLEIGTKRIIYLKCFHIITKTIIASSPFETMVSNDWKDEIKSCKHNFGTTNKCALCGEFKLYSFQVDGARYLEKSNGRAGIFDEMGLGKTVQSLAWLKFHSEAFPVLFVVKSGIKYQWAKEIVRWLGLEKFPQIISSSKDALLPVRGYIISYDMMVPKTRTRNGKAIIQGFDVNKFKEAGVKTIILDECQQIKNPDSTRTQMVRRIVKDLGHVIPLSGTPWKNRGNEFFPVLNMLDPIRFSSYARFNNEWVDSYFDGARTKVGGIRNPARFKEYVSDILIRRERSEVMKELPTIQRNAYYCEMNDDAAKAYSREETDFVKFWNEAVIGGDEDSFGMYQNILARITKMRHLTGLAKIPNTIEFVREFLEETERKKIAIFVHHKDVGQIIFDQLSSICREAQLPQPFKITADLSSEARFDVQEAFNRAEHAVLVGSTLASGEGLNLQTCADCIMHERQWNPANEEQAEGRFIRIGQQSNAVIATYMLAEGSIDDLFHGLVELKRAMFHEAMNSGEASGWNNESSMIKDLAQAIADKVNARGR